MTLDQWADHLLDRLKSDPKPQGRSKSGSPRYNDHDMLASFVAGFFMAYSQAKKGEKT